MEGRRERERGWRERKREERSFITYHPNGYPVRYGGKREREREERVGRERERERQPLEMLLRNGNNASCFSKAKRERKRTFFSLVKGKKEERA